MQFHEESSDNGHRISGYGVGYFLVDEVRIESSILLGAQAGSQVWEARTVAQLTSAMLDEVLDWAPDLVLLGTGKTHVFAPPALVSHAASRRTALESMTTGAACRTYNVLAGEGRAVAAMLLVIDS